MSFSFDGISSFLFFSFFCGSLKTNFSTIASYALICQFQSNRHLYLVRSLSYGFVRTCINFILNKRKKTEGKKNIQQIKRNTYHWISDCSMLSERDTITCFVWRFNLVATFDHFISMMITPSCYRIAHIFSKEITKYTRITNVTHISWPYTVDSTLI